MHYNKVPFPDKIKDGILQSVDNQVSQLRSLQREQRQGTATVLNSLKDNLMAEKQSKDFMKQQLSKIRRDIQVFKRQELQKQEELRDYLINQNTHPKLNEKNTRIRSPKAGKKDFKLPETPRVGKTRLTDDTYFVANNKVETALPHQTDFIAEAVNRKDNIDIFDIFSVKETHAEFFDERRYAINVDDLDFFSVPDDYENIQGLHEEHVDEFTEIYRHNNGRLRAIGDLDTEMSSKRPITTGKAEEPRIN